MIAPTAKLAWWISGLLVTAAIALGSEIPKPEGFWFQTWAGWATFCGLVLTGAAVIKMLAWPATEAQLRKGLRSEETRGTIVTIVREGFKERMDSQDRIGLTVGAHDDRLLMVENAIVQQGAAIKEMPDMVETLGRIETQIEISTRAFTDAVREMREWGKEVSEIRGELKVWNRIDRRRSPRE